MSGGSNGPLIVNGGANVYDRAVCFDAPVEFDTGLYVDPSIKTLLDLRTSLVRRLGFAANSTLSPGMADLLDDFLRDAQEQAYWRYPQLRTERWWGWQVDAGQRFFDVPIDCTKALNFRRITDAWLEDTGGRWVQKWVADTELTLGTFVIPSVRGDFDYEVTAYGGTGLTEPTWPTVDGGTVVSGSVTFTARSRNSRWVPLIAGIDPGMFNLDTVRTRPTHYELRAGLEIYPAPDQPYIVWLKGHMGLARFIQATDTCTIDAHAIFLLALANAKAHYGQPDAGNYVQQFEVYIRKLTAGAHGANRYLAARDTRGDSLPRPRRA